MENNYILEMRHVRKEFPGVVALGDVSLYLKRGEVHALLGENGAGKSTIMKILAGIYELDGGYMIYNGESYKPKRPDDALKKGISMVHQELDLIPEMSVEMNIFAGAEIMKGLIVDKKAMIRRTREVVKSLEIDIKPETKIKELSVAQMQMVAIAKAIAFEAEVIIMDEPTSAITTKEVEQLFRIIRKLKAQNKSIVYISHKMDEIHEISDQITILRDGNLIGTMETKKAKEETIIQMLVGRDLSNMYVKTKKKLEDYDPDEVLMSVESLTRNGEFRNIDFKLKRGEILGIYGLMGAGRTEVVETIFGLRKRESGKVFVKGKEVHSVKECIRNGVAFITEDRKDQGLNLIETVKNNIALVYMDLILSKMGIISAKKENKIADEYIKKLKIKTSSKETKVGTLSGGNQQKIVIAKWMLGEPDILIMDEPTRGIDIGAKAEIYQLMNEVANRGKAIIMISSETPELLGVSDRVIVMHEGVITGTFSVQEVTQEKLVDLVIG